MAVESRFSPGTAGIRLSRDSWALSQQMRAHRRQSSKLVTRPLVRRSAWRTALRPKIPPFSAVGLCPSVLAISVGRRDRIWEQSGLPNRRDQVHRDCILIHPVVCHTTRGGPTAVEGWPGALLSRRETSSGGRLTRPPRAFRCGPTRRCSWCRRGRSALTRCARHHWYPRTTSRTQP